MKFPTNSYDRDVEKYFTHSEIQAMIIAAVQCDFVIDDVPENVRRVRHRLEVAASNDARLVVFPECALSGYCQDSREEAFGASVEAKASDEHLKRIIDDCRRLNVYAIVGLLERSGDKVFNAAVCLGPEGVVSNYRKLHLPFLGVDRFVDPGDLPLSVFDVEGVRVGTHICYDGGFPEMARCFALMGADLVVLPTCWPPAADIFAAHVPIARALENQIYTLAAGRVGGERGYSFIGHSSIVAPGGFLLASGGNLEDTIIYADVDTAQARRKRIVRIPGLHEINRLADRRPEFYGEIVAPNPKWPRYLPGGPVRDEG
jgi:predicted amidohydrolase